MMNHFLDIINSSDHDNFYTIGPTPDTVPNPPIPDCPLPPEPEPTCCDRVLDADLHIYVRVDGNDANDGLEDTPERACLTVVGGLEKFKNYFGNGHYAYLHIGPGEFVSTETIFMDVPTGQSSGYKKYIIQGAGAGPAYGETPFTVLTNTTINAVLTSTCAISIMDVGFKHVGAGITSAGTIDRTTITRCTFTGVDATTSIGIRALYGGTLIRDIRFNGIFYRGLYNYTGYVDMGVAGNIVDVGNSSGSILYYALHGGMFYIIPSVVHTGTWTGAKFRVEKGGRIETIGAGVNSIPGTVAGTVDTATYGIFV